MNKCIGFASMVAYATMVTMFAQSRCICMAFTNTIFNKFQLHDTSSLPMAATTSETTLQINEQNDPTITSFHPLGPPSFLSHMFVGETYHHAILNKNITRISSHPDIFLIRDMLPVEDRETFIDAAGLQGMKVAGTRSSGKNTIRKNSFLTWIEQPLSSLDYGGSSPEAISVARKTIVNSRRAFSHEVMNELLDNADTDMVDYAFAEDVQVAKYDAGGRFDYHHDGYGRYLTVLSYLRPVGGTYFPFANMSKSELDGIDFTNEDEVSVMSFKQKVGGQCGVLVVGKEGRDAYVDGTVNPRNVIEIEAGDAIAFYNYDSNGERDLRSLHCRCVLGVCTTYS